MSNNDIDNNNDNDNNDDNNDNNERTISILPMLIQISSKLQEISF